MLNRLRDVFESLNDHEVRYLVIGGIAALVIGGIAAVLHGVPRARFDLDILIDATPENAGRLVDALAKAGLGTATLTTADDVLAHEITVFKDRVRVDVQRTTPGLDFAEGWSRRVEMRHAGQRFFVVSREDLIASKRAAGRPVDLDDVRLLERADASEDEP